MKYTPLAQSDLCISKIAFGCGPLGGSDWGAFNEKETMLAVSKAYELGINFFDTADIYGLGKSEELLSKALGSKRKEVVISTKFGVSWEKKQRKRALTFYDSSPKAITKALEGSLKRLKLDSIPLYFMHWPDPKTPIEESIETLIRFRDSGKIQHLGLSNFSNSQIIEINNAFSVSAVQSQYSLIDKSPEKSLFKICKSLDINLISYGSLGQGLLSAKYEKDLQYGDDDCRARLPHFHGNLYDNYVPLLKVLKQISKKYKVTPSQIALRWVFENPLVSSIISGIKNRQQVLENTNMLNLGLDEEDYIQINKVI